MDINEQFRQLLRIREELHKKGIDADSELNDFLFSNTKQIEEINKNLHEAYEKYAKKL